MNFFQDIADIFSSRLTHAGYVVEPSAGADEIVFSYLRVVRRTIQPVPRTVHKAVGFVCPPELQLGLDLVCQKATNGIPLRPHQSKRLKDTDYSDALLNDWDLHHFHLGTTFDAMGWADRTGPLLFARVTPSDFYCVDIVDHGGWYQQALVQRMHDSWPTAIAHARMQDVVALSHNASDADIKTLRSAHINTMLQMDDGTIYAPFGGGSNTDGSSTQATMQKISLVRIAEQLEAIAIQELGGSFGMAICQMQGATTLQRDQLDLHIAMGDDGVALVLERNTRAAMRLPHLALPSI